MSITNIPHTLILPEEREMTEHPSGSSNAAAENVEEEKFDKDFWLKVSIFYYCNHAACSLNF